MVTTTRTSAPRARTAAPKSRTSAKRSAPKSNVEKASDAVTGTAASLIDAVKASPIASAVIAAGVAGAGAVIWANRGQIAEQASALGEKASELGSKLGERASTVGEKLSEQATALGEKVSERYAAATGASAKTQLEIAEDELSLKQSGDPMLAEQSKVGSVSY